LNVSSVCKKNIQTRIRRIANRHVVLANGKCFEINDVSKFILDHLDGKTSLSKVIDLLMEEYEVDRGTLENDVFRTVEFLHANDIIIDVEGCNG